MCVQIVVIFIVLFKCSDHISIYKLFSLPGIDVELFMFMVYFISLRYMPFISNPKFDIFINQKQHATINLVKPKPQSIY